MGLSILINGLSGSGKSCSIKSLLGTPYKVLVLNCDAGKPLPFKIKQTLPDGTVKNTNIVQKTVHSWAEFCQLKNTFINSQADILVIDTVTLCLKMFEEQIIKKSSNKQTAWGDYQTALIDTISSLSKLADETNKVIVFMAHTATVQVGDTTVTQSSIAGGLKNLSLEAFFSFVVYATTKSVSELETFKDNIETEFNREFSNDLLTFTDLEKSKNVKHVFQTQTTQDTLNHRIKTGLDYFTIDQTYIDNNLLTLIQTLKD